MITQAAIDREALASFQSNLVIEKINSQQVHATLEKLGLVPEAIAEVPEVVNRVLYSISITSRRKTELPR